MRRMNLFGIAVGALAFGGLLAACDSGTTNPPNDMATPPDLWTLQPAGTVAVSFSVDDTANKVYTDGNLEWKGAMIYDPATRKITKDATWGGPWAPLYDDGPWTSGGHEPIGSTAGDHIWGITVFATPPAADADTYEYGLNDTEYQTNFGNGWAWKGSNGTFMVAAGATAPIKADGMTFAKFGTSDLRLAIDTTTIDMTTAWDTSKIGVKGSAWAWGVQNLTAVGTVYTFTLSDVVGAGKPFNHTGLLSSGDKPEFIYVFGAGTGKEYKDANGTALATGVTAKVKGPNDVDWVATQIAVNAANKNTYVTMP